MKINLLIFILFFSISFCDKTYSQDDSILIKLKSRINEDWKIEITNDTLIIERKGYMWIDFYNIAGAPIDDPEYKKYTDDYLKTNGRKTKAAILFKSEEKWESVKIKEIQSKNIKIKKEIENLISKYKLTHLKRTYRWHEELFWGETKKEEIRIKAYKKEKEELLHKIIPIPTYNSEKYSLFVISRAWRICEDGTCSHMLPMIYPKEEKEDIDNLEKIINEILLNNH